MDKIGKVGRGLFGVAVLSALGLGATQAFAGSPAPAERAFTCDDRECYRQCIANGIRSGYCSDGECVCGFPWENP